MPEDIYSLIENSGLPRIAKELKGLVRHAIILQTQSMDSEDTLAPGTSKIGSLPDLPPDLETRLLADAYGYAMLLREDTSERYQSFARSIAQTITLRA